MTDLPQLIARLTTLRDGLGLFHEADQEAITEAIAELAAKIPANMTDTAGLIARADAWAPHDNCWAMHQELVAALAAQAQEIEQLKEWGKKFHEVGSANAQRAAAAEAEVKRIKQMSLGSIYKEATDRLDAAEARVRELEEDAATCRAHRTRLYEERAAIEAATIERCAKKIESLAGDCWCRPSTWSGLDERDRLAAAIRALAKELIA